ncbi:basic proline-rich protein-like [Neofelis nebulosa]|uniref:basic proline-rich protein-like n=1 Tax=Neofelis nebulosa TaxID=61452 RepID=UPI00272C50AE|nr:basic proline-rich protein-like [Neofelis nebulosa]
MSPGVVTSSTNSVQDTPRATPAYHPARAGGTRHHKPRMRTLPSSCHFPHFRFRPGAVAGGFRSRSMLRGRGLPAARRPAGKGEERERESGAGQRPARGRGGKPPGPRAPPPRCALPGRCSPAPPAPAGAPPVPPARVSAPPPRGSSSRPRLWLCALGGGPALPSYLRPRLHRAPPSVSLPYLLLGRTGNRIQSTPCENMYNPFCLLCSRRN